MSELLQQGLCTLASTYHIYLAFAVSSYPICKSTEYQEEWVNIFFKMEEYNFATTQWMMEHKNLGLLIKRNISYA